jgi:hypothetical protein
MRHQSRVSIVPWQVSHRYVSIVAMIPRTQFRWKTLTVSFIGDAPASELTPTAALDRATAALARWKAKVSRDEGRGVLRFGPTFQSGRSWLSAVMSREVHAVTQGTTTVVAVSASIAPIVIMGVVFALLSALFVNPYLGILVGLGGITGGNYAFAAFGMRRILAETLFTT